MPVARGSGILRGRRDFVEVIMLWTLRWKLFWIICVGPVQSQGSLKAGGRGVGGFEGSVTTEVRGCSDVGP